MHTWLDDANTFIVSTAIPIAVIHVLISNLLLLPYSLCRGCTSKPLRLGSSRRVIFLIVVTQASTSFKSGCSSSSKRPPRTPLAPERVKQTKCMLALPTQAVAFWATKHPVGPIHSLQCEYSLHIGVIPYSASFEDISMLPWELDLKSNLGRLSVIQ